MNAEEKILRIKEIIESAQQQFDKLSQALELKRKNYQYSGGLIIIESMIHKIDATKTKAFDDIKNILS